MQTDENGLYIGAKVRIIDEPFYSCSAGWADEMDQYCGKEATIVGGGFGYCYRLDIDRGEWSWSADIITLAAPMDLPDLEVEESVDIFSLFR